MIIRPTAAALLLARGYRWDCPECGAANLEESAQSLTVTCPYCEKRSSVARVCHINGEHAVAPGIAPNCFPAADVLEVALDRAASVTLRAAGYKWVCPECDPWADASHFTPSAFLDTVECNRCGARFPVAAIKHRLGEHVRPRDLVGHALSYISEPERIEPAASADEAAAPTRATLPTWDGLFGGES